MLALTLLPQIPALLEEDTCWVEQLTNGYFLLDSSVPREGEAIHVSCLCVVTVRGLINKCSC